MPGLFQPGMYEELMGCDLVTLPEHPQQVLIVEHRYRSHIFQCDGGCIIGPDPFPGEGKLLI